MKERKEKKAGRLTCEPQVQQKVLGQLFLCSQVVQLYELTYSRQGRQAEGRQLPRGSHHWGEGCEKQRQKAVRLTVTDEPLQQQSKTQSRSINTKFLCYSSYNKKTKTNIKQLSSRTTSGTVSNSLKYDKTNILIGSRPIWNNKIRTKRKKSNKLKQVKINTAKKINYFFIASLQHCREF